MDSTAPFGLKDKAVFLSGDVTRRENVVEVDGGRLTGCRKSVLAMLAP